MDEDAVEEGSSSCGSHREWAAVQRVCGTLGMPCHHVDFVQEYWHQVFTPFLAMYEAGVPSSSGPRTIAAQKRNSAIKR